jgi:hypothetical protein
MDDKVNHAEKFASFDDHCVPKIIGDLNDYKLQIVKARGTPNTGDAGGPLTTSAERICRGGGETV